MVDLLPDFVVIGAQKAGTTWLGARLAEQPNVYLPHPGEVHFFDRDDNFGRGVSWYARHFDAAPAGTLIGEKTPDYLWTRRAPGRGPNDIPARMHAIVPDTRLIIILRDPVTRAISAFNDQIRWRNLSPFVDPDEYLLAGTEGDIRKDFRGLISRGHYLEHIQRFLAFFPRDRIHIILFEDELVASPQATLDGVMAFLGCGPAQKIGPPARPENKQMNSRIGLIINYYARPVAPLVSILDRLLPESPQRQPSESCRARLYEHFAPHNDALFAFLGRRSDGWLKPGPRDTAERDDG